MSNREDTVGSGSSQEGGTSSPKGSEGASRLEDGGPAFPMVDKLGQDKDGVTHFQYVGGATLRDYFAAKALQGLLGRPVDGPITASEQAYVYADAMLQARKVSHV